MAARLRAGGMRVVILSRPQRARLRQIVRGRSDEDLYVLEGPKPIAEALRTGAVAELWMRSDLDPTIATPLRDAAIDASVPIGEGAGAEFEQLAKTVTSQGVFALVRDPVRDATWVLGMDAPWVLWLDGVQDPGNAGALVRVAAGFGAGLLVSRGGAHPMGAKALRASAGLALQTPFALDDPARLAQACEIAGRGVWLLDAGGADVFEAALPDGPAVLVVGSEGHGVSDAARAAATHTAGITMGTGVESLNVAVATGIALAVLANRSSKAARS